MEPPEQYAAPTRVPWFAWANVTSLDAVSVGLIWVFIFTYQFCGRRPAIYESAIIGMSIWLVYTADRLFDSLRLDSESPHSLRHRFHHDHRRALAWLWVGLLGIDTATIVHFSNESQLRWGIATVGLTIGYLAAAQRWMSVDRWFPKELQIGIVFAFGTSLVAWSDGQSIDRWGLLVSSGLAAVLFALNCVTVGLVEVELDARQQFASLVRRMKDAAGHWLVVAIVHATATVMLGWWGTVPPLICGCLLTSNGLLCVLTLAVRRTGRAARVPAEAPAGSVAWFRWPIVFADLALVLPAILWAASHWATAHWDAANWAGTFWAGLGERVW